MIIQYIKARRLIDSRPPRERIIILITLIVILYNVWDAVAIKPFKQEQISIEKSITAVNDKLSEMDNQIRQYSIALEAQPVDNKIGKTRTITTPVW